MNESSAKSYSEFILPPSLVSKLDVSRMVTEMEQLDNDLNAANVRAKTVGATEATFVPVLSETLRDFLIQNKLTANDSKGRTSLIKQLRALKDKVPIVHMTFAVSADIESLQQLVQWLRTSVHPQAVISVGLQPGLVAGVHLRTPNHVHDFSLKAKLAGSHDVLIKELEAYRG
ncbi:hypothetical protein I8H83_03245 [Candidatus Saccharibacteria bacterium]|nr:hypothetical protein [Candidatus Saccharibacteria bacterium]